MIPLDDVASQCLQVAEPRGQVRHCITGTLHKQLCPSSAFLQTEERTGRLTC